MNHQYEHAVTTINLLHEEPTTMAMIEMTALKPRRKPEKFYHVNAQFCAEWALEKNTAKYSVFVNVNPRKAMAAFDSDVAYTTALALDLQPEKVDIDGVIARIGSFGIPPTALANSGHGAHGYLKLTEPCDPILARTVATRLCTATGSDPIFNPARIMRLPGSVNWKSVSEPRLCFLVDLQPQRLYTLDQITAALDAMGAPPSKLAVPSLPRESIAPPFDYFALRSRLSAQAREILDSGEPNPLSPGQPTRSEADWLVMCALIRADATDEQIHWIYDTQPIRNLKFAGTEHHYLVKTIESARRVVGAEPPWFKNANLRKRLLAGKGRA
jgi:hypothetical protein